MSGSSPTLEMGPSVAASHMPSHAGTDSFTPPPASESDPPRPVAGSTTASTVSPRAEATRRNPRSDRGRDRSHPDENPSQRRPPATIPYDDLLHFLRVEVGEWFFDQGIDPYDVVEKVRTSSRLLFCCRRAKRCLVRRQRRAQSTRRHQ